MTQSRGLGGAFAGRQILVTGGAGRVGRNLVNRLANYDASVSVLTRSASRAKHVIDPNRARIVEADITDLDRLVESTKDIDTIFHLASHGADERQGSVYEDPGHWRVTVEGTRCLTRAAEITGCKRIVYFSSIKAMGEEAGANGCPQDESRPECPKTLYGRAKLTAEQCLRQASERAELQTTILRLPMIYGLDGYGNLDRMLRAVARGRFPPFPRISNRRSAVHVDDAIEAALLCAAYQVPATRVFIVTDGNAYSTRWIYERMRLALGKKVPARATPLWVWKVGAAVGSFSQRSLGWPAPLTRETLQKLAGDAWFDSTRICAEVGFTPRQSLGNEIERMARRYEGKGVT